jgi:hypothetical protein
MEDDSLFIGVIDIVIITIVLILIYALGKFAFITLLGLAYLIMWYIKERS